MYILMDKSPGAEIARQMGIFKEKSGEAVDIIFMSAEQWEELLKPSYFAGAEVKLSAYLPWNNHHIVMTNKEYFNEHRFKYNPYISRIVVQTTS